MVYLDGGGSALAAAVAQNSIKIQSIQVSHFSVSLLYYSLNVALQDPNLVADLWFSQTHKCVTEVPVVLLLGQLWVPLTKIMRCRENRHSQSYISVSLFPSFLVIVFFVGWRVFGFCKFLIRTLEKSKKTALTNSNSLAQY
jgi:hypothetical protein